MRFTLMKATKATQAPELPTRTTSPGLLRFTLFLCVAILPLGAQEPTVPSFPAGPATFTIISGTPTPEQLADLQALHALHDRDYAALLAAFEQRQAAQLAARQAQAEQEAKPPQDVVIRYRVMTPDELENR